MSDRAQSQVRIGASPARVMDVVADIASYPEWNSEVKAAEVLEVGPTGRPSRVRFVIDANPIRDTYILEYDWHGLSRVNWHLTEGEVLDGLDGSYLLDTVGPGETEVTYSLSVELRIPVLGILKRKGEKLIVDRALKGLKARVESLPPD